MTSQATATKIGGIWGFDKVRHGYELEADVVVVGSGPGGAVAADNLAAAGMRVVLVEAGPQVRPEDMTVAPPLFLAKYYWEGGTRMVAGSTPNPCMQGRALGGSTVMNSAIMLKLPTWVRDAWAADDGVGAVVHSAGFERAFERVFARTNTVPTPMTVLGRRNELVRDALAKAGLNGVPLPRAVKDCDGCADCITGCHTERKQSMDRAYIPGIVANGGIVCTHSNVDRILVEKGRAVGVTGTVVDLATWQNVARFTVRAPRVIVAGGPGHTAVLLLKSGITGGGRVGKTLYVHITGAATARMEEIVEPWRGATQGWGAISDEIHGLKYESLWAAPSLIGVNMGGLGHQFLRELDNLKHTTVIACVCKAKVNGNVKIRPDGLPLYWINVPDRELAPLMRGLKTAADALLGIGARWVGTSVWGVPERMRTTADTEALLAKRVKPHHCHMTFNHIFGSCKMSADPKRGPVDLRGAVRGVSGVWVTDSSIFPEASAVNPQATIMALSDVISRGIGDMAA